MIKKASLKGTVVNWACPLFNGGSPEIIKSVFCPGFALISVLTFQRFRTENAKSV